MEYQTLSTIVITYRGNFNALEGGWALMVYQTLSIIVITYRGNFTALEGRWLKGNINLIVIDIDGCGFVCLVVGPRNARSGWSNTSQFTASLLSKR